MFGHKQDTIDRLDDQLEYAFNRIDDLERRRPASADLRVCADAARDAAVALDTKARKMKINTGADCDTWYETEVEAEALRAAADRISPLGWADQAQPSII